MTTQARPKKRLMCPRCAHWLMTQTSFDLYKDSEYDHGDDDDMQIIAQQRFFMALFHEAAAAKEEQPPHKKACCM